MSFCAVLDANVLYPSVLRSIFIGLAQTGLFTGRWTRDINEEWIRNAANDSPNATHEKLLRSADLMNAAVRDCLVEGYEPLIPSLDLPSEKDRHVLAAAIKGKADAIVTFNLKDFPEEYLEPYQIQPLHPDDFMIAQLDLDQALVLQTIRAQRLDLKKTNPSAEEIVERLLSSEMPQTASRLRPMTALF